MDLKIFTANSGGLVYQVQDDFVWGEKKHFWENAWGPRSIFHRADMKPQRTACCLSGVRVSRHSCLHGTDSTGQETGRGGGGGGVMQRPHADNYTSIPGNDRKRWASKRVPQFPLTLTDPPLCARLSGRPWGHRYTRRSPSPHTAHRPAGEETQEINDDVQHSQGHSQNLHRML